MKKIKQSQQSKKRVSTRSPTSCSKSTPAGSNEKWAVQFKLWIEEKTEAKNVRERLKAQEAADRLCPGSVCQKTRDLPLWEMEMLRHESKRKQESVENNQRWAEESTNSDPDRAKSFQVDLKHAKRKAAIYQQAYEATKVDAERLCPGKTFTSATGIASLGRRETVTSINVFKEAQKLAEKEIDRYEESILNAEKMLKEYEESLARYGNQD
ncbi:uncharacterized protein ACLA_044030 [Aspergillus clavatus NRRL 1]|uniref:Uncharacterized protein n=1 Tax=Aspergillus clavatus (strain ATCC 1007 / CBS 513.65 / DSM 816 / NCTC 3887 / NRRL 1 / QM 1276 / 107) TaxID=344612 RepID=A1C8P6_ASPCL|nr:uncharacterized protein ACLA_044030 [Aspergillus clavatus NRRL 1]EAW13683.1 hypothetical protein ACLA_044030 [Aspergillus clavatus NRRL 1]